MIGVTGWVDAVGVGSPSGDGRGQGVHDDQVSADRRGRAPTGTNVTAPLAPSSVTLRRRERSARVRVKLSRSSRSGTRGSAMLLTA